MITFLRNLVLDDFLLKFVSLGLAVLIWVTVSTAIPKETALPSALNGSTEERTFRHTPVQVVSSAADVREFKVNPDAVDVTVRGDPETVRKLEVNEIRALLDLTGIESARELRKRVAVSTPPGVSLERVSPEEVQVLAPQRNPKL